MSRPGTWSRSRSRIRARAGREASRAPSGGRRPGAVARRPESESVGRRSGTPPRVLRSRRRNDGRRGRSVLRHSSRSPRRSVQGAPFVGCPDNEAVVDVGERLFARAASAPGACARRTSPRREATRGRRRFRRAPLVPVPEGLAVDRWRGQRHPSERVARERPPGSPPRSPRPRRPARLSGGDAGSDPTGPLRRPSEATGPAAPREGLPTPPVDHPSDRACSRPLARVRRAGPGVDFVTLGTPFTEPPTSGCSEPSPGPSDRPLSGPLGRPQRGPRFGPPGAPPRGLRATLGPGSVRRTRNRRRPRRPLRATLPGCREPLGLRHLANPGSTVRRAPIEPRRDRSADVSAAPDRRLGSDPGAHLGRHPSAPWPARRFGVLGPSRRTPLEGSVPASVGSPIRRARPMAATLPSVGRARSSRAPRRCPVPARPPVAVRELDPVAVATSGESRERRRAHSLGRRSRPANDPASVHAGTAVSTPRPARDGCRGRIPIGHPADTRSSTATRTLDRSTRAGRTSSDPAQHLTEPDERTPPDEPPPRSRRDTPTTPTERPATSSNHHGGGTAGEVARSLDTLGDGPPRNRRRTFPLDLRAVEEGARGGHRRACGEGAIDRVDDRAEGRGGDARVEPDTPRRVVVDVRLDVRRGGRVGARGHRVLVVIADPDRRSRSASRTRRRAPRSDRSRRR